MVFILPRISVRVGLAVAAAVAAICWAEVSAASSSGSLRIAGRVLPQAGIWFSQLSPLLFSFSAKAAENGRMRLTDLSIFGNNRQFTVSLLSQNAESIGAPSLVDPETGNVLPYVLTLGDDELTFIGGEAQIATGEETHGGVKSLELGMPKKASVDAGRFQERLTIVVAAR